MPLESTLTAHTEPPTFRKEQFTLPLHQDGEYCLELKAVELMWDLKYALSVEPETRVWFADYLQNDLLLGLKSQVSN